MNVTVTIPPKVLRAKEAAAYLGIAKSTFWRWVKDEVLPEGTELSPRCRVWEVADMDAFLESKRK